MLTPWHADRILVDPFCGSGTFPIEAAMMAANIAPGMNREFTAESWTNIIPRKLWYEAVQEAEDMIDKDVQVDIQGYDIDPDVVAAARENAKRAGVEHMIHFQQRAVADLHHPKKYGFIISNPPYGERLEEKSALPALYSQIGEAYKRLDAWSMYLITSYEDTERYIGRKADKNRKIYNGMIKTYFYQFMGPKPPRRKKGLAGYMKYSKRYIAFTFILALIFVSNFYIYAKDSSTLGAFRGAQIDNTIWSPLVAADVNGTTIRLRIENKEYTSEDEHVYMDENRNIMVPVSMLRDALNSSAHVYNKNELLVEKHSLTADFKLADDNGFVQYKGQFYASLDKLSKLLDMTCSFDTATNTLTMTDKSEGVSTVPTKYDLRERQRVSLIRDQGSYGTCWAFAATSALESALMPEEQLLFSVDHMSMSNSFNVNQYDGGEYTMGMAYLAAWQGPVYDADDPYGDGVTRDDLAAVKHVQQMLIIDGKDYQGIKEAVFKYGGVQTSLYSTIASSKTKTPYYNKQTNSYCYMGQDKPNHDVVIIGWDDNYPKENFNVDLEGDGAFICQNSWGSSFGDNGVFYVSYYDTNVGTHNVVYTDIESADNYDNIYQSDLCGWVGKMGYDKEDMYGANIFTAQSAESLRASGFYATAADTSYKLYVVKNFENEYSFKNKTLVAEGSLKNAGYYTVDFDEPVDLESGERYAIVLYINTPGSTHPMAIEYNSGEAYMSTVNLDDGEGYISYDGVAYINVKEKQDCNLCIKAFSDNR